MKFLCFVFSVLVSVTIEIFCGPTPLPTSTSSPHHCNYDFIEHELIESSHYECENITLAESELTSTTPSSDTNEDTFDFDCYFKCFFTGMKLVGEDGNIIKSNISQMLKTTARSEMENNRVEKWTSCADSAAKDAKPENKDSGACSTLYTDFFDCGITAEHEIYEKCQSDLDEASHHHNN